MSKQQISKSRYANDKSTATAIKCFETNAHAHALQLGDIWKAEYRLRRSDMLSGTFEFNHDSRGKHSNIIRRGI